jgi:hypothetical protein
LCQSKRATAAINTAEALIPFATAPLLEDVGEALLPVLLPLGLTVPFATVALLFVGLPSARVIMYISPVESLDTNNLR